MVLFSLAATAQNQGYRLHQRIDDAKINLRWEPLSWEDFEHAIRGNMTLRAYAFSGPDVRPTLTLLEETKIEPLDYRSWRADLGPSNWDTIALAAIYTDRLDPALREETFVAREYGDTPRQEEEARWQVSNYALGYDWTAIERSAMGWQRARAQDAGVDRYAVKVFPTLDGDTLYYSLDLRNYRPPAMPELEARFYSKRAELQWRTIDAKPEFFAWHLERSVDGAPFTDVFDLPLVNDYDTTATVDEALKYLYHTNRFKRNDDSIVYRLRGQDHLGFRSENYSEARGAGAEDIKFSPLLTQTEQTDSNYAIIHWEYDAETIDRVAEFRIVHKDSLNAEYEVALAGIAPDVRRVALPMKYRANFYRVQAVSKIGTVYSSFESLVMCYDDEPPATPRDFTGTIDSNGVTRLSWTTSNEFDLAGYYLFKGYYENTELAMITPDPLAGPEHIDSVDMVTPNETVYYQLRSVDTRGNSSNFTPVLALKKPDVYPPAPPQFTAIDNERGRIRLDWTTSPAPDVAAYRLFRAEGGSDGDYALLREWDKATYPAYYLDTLVKTGITYSYVLRSVDDDGLVSSPSEPVILKLRDFGLRPPVVDFTASGDQTTRSITLNWAYAEDPRDFYLYRQTGDRPMVLLKVVAGDQRTYRDEGLRKNVPYTYLMRGIFPDGKVTPFTDKVTVILE